MEASGALVGGAGRWDGEELGAVEGGRERGVGGVWEGELEAREHPSKRSKAVCLRRVRDEGFCFAIQEVRVWDSNSRTDPDEIPNISEYSLKFGMFVKLTALLLLFIYKKKGKMVCLLCAYNHKSNFMVRKCNM